MLGTDGYATFKSSDHSGGNKTGQSYYGPNDEPVFSKKNGYHGWRQITHYMQRDGCDCSGFGRKPMLVVDGYVTFKRRTIHVAMRHGETTMGSQRRARLEEQRLPRAGQAEDHEQNRQTVVTYLGLEGKPMLIADGYATFKSSYDSRGNMTGQSYYGVNGEPAGFEGGWLSRMAGR